MYIPNIKDINIKNKNLVYNDTVLTLKENNITITTIPNISFSNIENCLKIIFESNKDVIFNTIQYSNTDNKLYIYANKKINTTKYDEYKYFKHNDITNNSLLLQEIKDILLKEKNKNLKCISLYDLLLLMRNTNLNYNNLIKSYELSINMILKQIYNNISFLISDFDYNNNELKIEFKYNNKTIDVNFSKCENKLYITEGENTFTNDVLNTIGKELGCLYDDLFEYKEFIKEKINNIKAVNSNFLININNHYISIRTNNKNINFELKEYINSNNTSYKCNLDNVIESFKGNEKLLFEKIYVNIKDCPRFIYQTLYEFRRSQLLEDKKFEEEEYINEINEQKKLNLKRKFFPWIKS